MTQYVTEYILIKPSFMEYEIIREAYWFFGLLAKKNYQQSLLLEVALKSYKKFGISLWKPVETIILNCFQTSGRELFLRVFQVVKPELLPPNPLWTSFE